MKKILLFTAAVILLTAFNNSQVNAELALSSTNGGSFSFDPAGNSFGDSLITTNGDNGLSDLAIYLGYRQEDAFTGSNNTEFIKLDLGTATVDSTNSSQGSFEFDRVTFESGVGVDAVANFQLIDATGESGTGVGHHVIYDLDLTTFGVDDDNQGALQSFVGFDFNGTSADSAQSPPPPIIPGFGFSQVAIGSVDGDRVLAGDFSFDSDAGPGGIVPSNSSNVDVFSGPIGADLDARFNGELEVPFETGDLAFGSFTDFNLRTVPDSFTAGGVVGFRSATIPEPSTLLMASMGLGMVAFRRRKRA